MAPKVDFDTKYQIRPGRHLYQFYKAREDYLRIVMAYIQAGLEKGDACLWLLSEKMNPEEVKSFCRKTMKRFSFYTTTSQLEILSAEQWYLKDGIFDEAQSLQNAGEYLERILNSGYAVLRAVGDAGAIPYCDWPKLHGYEEKVTELVRQAPVISLCAYPIHQCSISAARGIVETHDAVLVGRT